MSKRKYRRTVSMRPELYIRLRRYCERNGDPVAAVADRAISYMLAQWGEPEVTKQEAIAELQRLAIEAEAARDADRRIVSGVHIW